MARGARAAERGSTAARPTGRSGQRPTSRYREIERYLRRLIAAGAPGDALPTEAELCARFEVSRMTARQALNVLAGEGLVGRQRGRGTFITAPPLHRRPGVFLSFTEEMERRGLDVSSRLSFAGISPARPEERVDLELADGADVVRIVRTRLAGGAAIAVEDAVVRVEFAAVLASDLRIGSLHAALVGLGVVATSAMGSVRARLPTRDEVVELDAPGQALLIETRLLFDQHGVAFERTESRYAGDRYAIDVVHAHP